MKQTNPIQHETMPLKKLMRAPWGTVGQYTCAVKDTNRASSRITAYATHAGAKIQTERYACINQRTGATMAIIQAKVTKRGRPLQKPGRKKNLRPGIADENTKVAPSGDTVYHGGTI